MNFEKSSQQPDNPENNLKDMLVKATEEVKEKEEQSIKSAGGSLDDFLAEIKPVEIVPEHIESEEVIVPATEIEVKEELQQERNRQAKEKIQPLIDKFKELTKEKNFNDDYIRGQEEYVALKGDKEKYRQLHVAGIDSWLARADLYEQALKEYHEAGGEGDLQEEMWAGTTRERVLNFEQNAMGGADAMFEKQQALLAGKYDKSGDYKSRYEVRATTPDDYVSKLVSNAVAVAGQKEQWGNNPQMQKNNLRQYFEKRSQGFGIEALDHGDVLVAARSLALAEAVGEIPDTLQEQMRVSYKKLDEAKKAEFGTALAREREGIKHKLEQAFA